MGRRKTLGATAQCKDCLGWFTKTRVYVSETAAYYYDDNGKMWRGRLCPACHNKQTNAFKAEMHKKATPRGPTRPCRRCNKTLPSKYYYYHERCRPDAFMESDDGDNTYMVLPYDPRGATAWAG